MPVLAALASDDLGYRLLLFGHLAAVIAGFGAAMVLPAFRRAALSGRAPGVVGATATVFVRTVLPGIWLAGIFGFLLVLLGGSYDFDETWISVAMALFLVLAVLVTFLLFPNTRRLAALAGSPDAGPELARRGRRIEIVSGIVNLLFLVLLIDMVWKPG